MMQVYTCKDHAGRWPVGACSVVVAWDETQARELLAAALKADDLDPDGFTLQLLDLSTPKATILLNGDY